MTFFFNDPAPTEIYTLSLHDALPISTGMIGDPKESGERTLNSLDTVKEWVERVRRQIEPFLSFDGENAADRKSTRLNSSHSSISYAVFCLKKKKKNKTTPIWSLHPNK